MWAVFVTNSRSRTTRGPSAVRPPASSDGEESPRWVNLGRACEILGVNESTVRRWADSGEIRCFRTPGGHRRFAEEDLFTLIRGDQDHALEAAAVRRIRRRLHSGSKDAGWYGTLDADEREALRPLGRRLVELVGDYITKRQPRAEIEAEVDAIGHSYGDLLVSRETPLLRAMEAFTFFRRSLDETAKQLAERDQMDAEQAAMAREQIGGLADRVLLGVTAAYDDR
ncbi:MAG: helix-turn-helix domain-containing protein [Chloroflexi bacterium]|nr:helix-turn-helix domain-containing protein [Chloroflexota bacterium]